MAALEVADIFRDHGAAWRDARSGHLSRDQLKVMSAIERCRSAALGGHLLCCEDCAQIQIAYNSCRNRHCPKCQGSAARRWLQDRQADLLPVDYYHVVFTLPAPISDIAYHNKAVIYALLFRAAAETLLTIAADPKRLGARLGITAVLHTWGSALTHHPHLHCIVPGGGLSLGGQRWVACKPGFFLPVRVLSRLFRRLFLEQLSAAHHAGHLQFFGPHQNLAEAQDFAHYLSPLRQIDWVVYAKRPFAGPEAVLAYLVALYPSGRHQQQPTARLRSTWRHLQVEGLSRQAASSLQDHDPGHARVHPALSHPCAAHRLPPHPSLRTPRQPHPDQTPASTAGTPQRRQRRCRPSNGSR